MYTKSGEYKTLFHYLPFRNEVYQETKLSNLVKKRRFNLLKTEFDAREHTVAIHKKTSNSGTGSFLFFDEPLENE